MTMVEGCPSQVKTSASNLTSFTLFHSNSNGIQTKASQFLHMNLAPNKIFIIYDCSAVTTIVRYSESAASLAGI